MGLFNKSAKAEEEMNMALSGLFNLRDKAINRKSYVSFSKTGYRFENDELTICWWEDNTLDVTYTLRDAMWRGEALDRFFAEGYNSETSVTRLTPHSPSSKDCVAFTIQSSGSCRDKEVFSELTFVYLEIFEMNWDKVEALAAGCNLITYGRTRRIGQ